MDHGDWAPPTRLGLRIMTASHEGSLKSFVPKTCFFDSCFHVAEGFCGALNTHTTGISIQDVPRGPISSFSFRWIGCVAPFGL